MSVFSKIENCISELKVEKITDDRKEILNLLVTFVQKKVQSNQQIRLNFICTHNSRRSHLSQVWAQTMAYFFNVKNVFCYSGGTESTALFPVAAQTLKNVGFEVQEIAVTNNPIYSIKYSENEAPVIGFSKKMDAAFNPKSEYAAIMTCSQADEGCPIIVGAEQRIPITYEDPKAFDKTSQQAEKYHERSLQIAAEMFYVFSQIKA